METNYNSKYNSEFTKPQVHVQYVHIVHIKYVHTVNIGYLVGTSIEY